MNTYPVIPNSGVLEFRNRLDAAAADRTIDVAELRGALSALTEDDGRVDEFERSASAKVLSSPGFQKISTAEARAVPRHSWRASSPLSATPGPRV